MSLTLAGSHRAEQALRLGRIALWLFAGVTLLSIAAQNFFFFAPAAILFAAWQRHELGRVISSGPAWRFLPFLAWALAASLASSQVGHSLDTWKKWLLLLALWVPPLLLSARPALRAVLGSLLFFSGLWCAGSGLIALKGPLQALLSGEALALVLARWPEVGEWRAVSGSGGYMVLGTGSMLLLCFFSALALEDKDWRRPLPLLCLAALGVALLLTQTRSAWIGAALGLAVLFAPRKPLLFTAAAGLLLALALLWPGNPLALRLRQGLDMTRDSTRQRVYMAEAGLAIISQNPWLGVGDAMETRDGVPGQYRMNMPEAAKVHLSLREREEGHLHNDLIQVAAMYGLPALGLLLWALAALLRRARQAAQAAEPLQRGLGWGYLAAFVAWWGNGMLEYNFGSFQSSFTFWFLGGLMLCAQPKVSE